MALKKTVATITRRLTKIAEELDAHKKVMIARAEQVNAQITELNVELNECDEEQIKAEKIASNIRNLLEG